MFEALGTIAAAACPRLLMNAAVATASSLGSHPAPTSDEQRPAILYFRPVRRFHTDVPEAAAYWLLYEEATSTMAPLTCLSL